MLGQRREAAYLLLLEYSRDCVGPDQRGKIGSYSGFGRPRAASIARGWKLGLQGKSIAACVRKETHGT